MVPASLGIFAKTFPGTTPLAVLSAARDAGYAAVQYNMACSGLASLPLQVGDDVIESMRDAVDRTGVRIAALSATFNMIHPDPVERARGLLALRALAQVARAAGIPILTLCTGSRNVADQWAAHPDNTSAEAWKDLLAGMTAALDVAEANDLVLGIEPEPGNVVDSAVTARRLLDALPGERVGVILDIANLTDPARCNTPSLRQAVINEAVALLADRIVLVHAKDRAADGAVVAPGHGIMEFDYCLRALVAAGVRVPVITHGLEARDATAAARFLSDRIQGAVLA